MKEGEWGRRALTGRGNCPEVCFSELSSVQLADSFQTSRGFHVNLPLLQTFPSPLIPRIVEQTVKTRTITPPSLKNRLVRILFVRSDPFVYHSGSLESVAALIVGTRLYREKSFVPSEWFVKEEVEDEFFNNATTFRQETFVLQKRGDEKEKGVRRKLKSFQSCTRRVPFQANPFHSSNRRFLVPRIFFFFPFPFSSSVLSKLFFILGASTSIEGNHGCLDRKDLGSSL